MIYIHIYTNKITYTKEILAFKGWILSRFGPITLQLCCFPPMIELLDSKEQINFKEKGAYYNLLPFKIMYNSHYTNISLFAIKLHDYFKITNLNVLPSVQDLQVRGTQSHPLVLCFLYSILPQVLPRKVTWNVRISSVSERWWDSENEVKIVGQGDSEL